MASVTQELVNFAVDTKFEQLPNEVINETKRVLLDCIGCALAGLATEKGKFSLQLSRRLGGPSESTVIGAGDKVSACSAAFANGELINALDYEVGTLPGHAPPCVIPASLALAECVGASGRDLILAMVISHEISARLGSALPSLIEYIREGPHAGTIILPPVHGYGSCVFGGTAGAGRILKLGCEKMSHAFGISGYAAPVPAMVKWYKSPPTAMTKYVSAGWVSEAEVVSALLAEMGYTGDITVLDGEYGFWRIFGGDKDKWDPNKVTEGLGKTWHFSPAITKGLYKRYPCCLIFGNMLDSFINIINENNLMPEDIETVRVLGAPLIEEPIWQNRDIRTEVDAQFSVPYAFAVAAHRIRIGAEWQNLRTIGDVKLRRFMDKVSAGMHPEHLNSSDKGPSIFPFVPSSVEVVAKGKLFMEENPYVGEGDLDFTEKTCMTDEDLIGKFENNASTILPQSKIKKAISLILELEKVENVSELMGCISL
jgi:2-methylcitrate dehydratase PrpD